MSLSKSKRFKLLILITLLALLNLIWFLVDQRYQIKYNINYSAIIPKQIQNRDWHDHKSMKIALARTGIGEVGAAVLFDEYQKALYKEYGFDVILSDQISVNRSVPDVRPKDCMKKKYSAKLPKAGIIIIFYNERMSVLLRTVHGILNRTPDELIQEIILVDDCSPWAELHEPLTAYVNEHFPAGRSKVRLLRLQKRGGLIAARMAGARAASKKSEVLVFLDSHFEVNYNWLPPLLDPIALNPKACTVPAIDRISFKTLKYEFAQPFRGYFDWSLNYMMRPVHPAEEKNPAANFPEYIMLGCAMAIGAEFFWNIGGFDDEMKIWGGEQFEISFKVWMCGGELISVPCSRLGHLFRDPNTKGNTNLYGTYDFVDYNYRRLVDVWFDDEHREYVVKNRKSITNVYPGDLSDRIAIRERMQCKSFSWMMDNIMSDLKEIFPPNEPGDNGKGLIYSKKNPNVCISLTKENNVVLADCNDKKNFEDWQKFWHYTWRCEIRIGGTCLESDIRDKRVNTYSCHLVGGNQKWYFDPQKQWIVQLQNNVCMVANVNEMRVGLIKCDESNPDMKWVISTVNQTTSKTCAQP